MTTVRRSIEDIAKKVAPYGPKQAYLAEDYDGIGQTVLVRMSLGSSSAVMASVAAGSFGTEQVIPANTPVYVLESNGHIEVTSLGSKLSSTAITSEMLSQDLSILDPQGIPSITPGGFSGTWSELISDGLYNSRFQFGNPGIIDDGLSEDLPYWTVSRTGSPTLELISDDLWPGGQYLQATFSSIDDRLYLVSNLVPVTGGQEYSITIHRAFDCAVDDVGEFDLRVRIHFYDAAGNLIDTYPTAYWLVVTGSRSQYTDIGAISLSAPDNACFGSVEITSWENAYDATGKIQVGAITFKAVATAISTKAGATLQGLSVAGAFILDSTHAPIAYVDTGSAGTVTITNADTYYGITGCTSAVFYPEDGRHYKIEGTISAYHNSATSQSLTIQWCIMESDGTTLDVVLNYTRHNNAGVASQWGAHHFSGIWVASVATPGLGKRFRPRFTVSVTNGAVVGAAFVNLVITPLPTWN